MRLESWLGGTNFVSDTFLRWIQQLVKRFNMLATIEDWHEVGATNEPAFESSWVNYDAGYDTAAFSITGTGVVYIKGLVKSGAAFATVFTLPVGYRPALDLIFSVIQGDNTAIRLTITSGGVLIFTSTDNAFVSLSCSFRVA